MQRQKAQAFMFVFSVLVTTAVRVSEGTVLRISDLSDFNDFAAKVNSGEGCTNIGTTVVLENDIDFSGDALDNFPIGPGDGGVFCGTFDGRGHVISNLRLTKNNWNVGLFGRLRKSPTIRNLIIDDTCSFTSTHTDNTDSLIGSIAGYDEAEGGKDSVIENIVNMASVSATGGNSARISYIGGLVGFYGGSDHKAIMRNCANYGNVEKSGNSKNVCIGGLVGYTSGSDDKCIIGSSITNSLFCGTITYSGSSSGEVRIGGIAGRVWYNVDIRNCVNSGRTINNGGSGTAYIGTIVGLMMSNSGIRNCYWSSENSGKAVGKYDNDNCKEVSSFNTDLVLTNSVSFGSNLGSVLNNWANANVDPESSGWLVNKNGNKVTFSINNGRSFSVSGQKVILLPEMADTGKLNFDGWYTNQSKGTKFTQSTADKDTTLYGFFEENSKNYTITFDTGNGTAIPSVTALFGAEVTLPTNSYMKDHTLAMWKTQSDGTLKKTYKMPGENIILRAVWVRTSIRTEEDLIELSRAVNEEGATLENVTVVLENDLDFSSVNGFAPIGLHKYSGSSNEEDYRPFLGTFDGQGHAIHNLSIAGDERRIVGLFGYSEGSVIRNVALGPSCTFNSSFSSSYNSGVSAITAGILGYCATVNNGCIIENSVSMAAVTYSGNVNYGAVVGGILGECYTFNHGCTVKNCANYGVIATSKSDGGATVGGILGAVTYYELHDTYVANCLNQATMYGGQNVTGGIVGASSSNTKIENCVNDFQFGTALSGASVGGISGSCEGSTEIKNCYWCKAGAIESFGGSKAPTVSGSVCSYDKDTLELSSGKGSLIEALNANLIGGFSVWTENEQEKVVSYYIDGHTFVTTSAKVILNPSLASSDNYTFHGWYVDEYHEFPYFNTSINENITLYGNFTLPPKLYPGSSSSVSSISSGLPSALSSSSGLWHIFSSSGPDTEYVEILFGTKDLTKDDVKEIIKKFTREEFVIEKFEKSEDVDETIVVIRFVGGSEKAKEFTRNVEDHIREFSEGVIMRVRSVEKDVLSLSIGPCVCSLLMALLL